MSDLTEPAPRDYAGTPLLSVQPDAGDLPQELKTWVAYGTIDGQKHVMFNPYDDTRFAPSGDTVQAWVRRRKALHTETMVTPMDRVERDGMDRVANMQDASLRLRKSLDIADRDKQDWRKALLALAKELKEQADERDWCEEYDNLMDKFADSLPGNVEWEFKDAAVRMVEVEIVRERKFVIWVRDSATTEVRVTDKDALDELDYFDDDTTLPYYLNQAAGNGEVTVGEVEETTYDVDEL